jgi:ABC-2 type transport system permease protein
LNEGLANLGLLPHEGKPVPPVWQVALIIGLTAGLCEELARTGAYALLRKARSLPDGIMLGLGHGGFEAMAFVGIQIAAAITSMLPFLDGDLSSLNLPPDQLETAQKVLNTLMASPWQAFIPLIDRLLAMGIHVAFSVMVLRAFQKRNGLWVVLAIVYHAFIDAAAVYAMQTELVTDQWAMDGLFFLVALPGYLWLAWIIWKEAGSIPRRHILPVAREWNIFALGVKKELLQAWRTRRVLIIAAVFGLFGMISPLTAYFLPEMMKSIPGAEQFAALIPVATGGDAMMQYIKNISQFGFILALLLGMGVVAGEKESGTASLVLSKPMTRWAFVASKLAAQLILYTAGFVIALLGCYIYTVALFGSLNIGPFLLLNLVLLFWLLPYVALTLVGSVIGKTTGAAAGVALVLIVALMLAGSLPAIANLMPGSLISWANQLGNTAAGVAPSSPGGVPLDSPSLANGAALASSAVFLVMGLVLSIGLFERQELE